MATNEELARAMGVTPDTRRAELAEKGRELVSAVMRQVEAAQDKPGRVEALMSLLDPDNADAARAIMFADSIWFRGQFMLLNGHRMKGDGQQIVRLLQGGATRGNPTGDDIADLTGVPGLRSPPGYHIDATGVYIINEEKVRVASAPVIVSAIAQDVERGGVRLELRWRGPTGWASHTVDRYVAADSRALTRLASDGLPVHSGNATDLVRYLAAFEAHNQSALPRMDVTRHMGWTGDSFLWGVEDLTGTDLHLEASPDMLERAKRYSSGGTWEGWCDAIAHYVCPSPSAMLAVYASAAAPLLRLLASPGFVIDWSGETSIGKTTTLRAAASVWGVPDAEDGIIGTGSGSTFGVTVTAWFTQSMPVILDDTKEATDDVVSQLLYRIPSGREGDKGTQDGGLREAKTWRTILLSTGESPITSRSQDGGARARTLCLEGSPIHSGDQASAIYHTTREHYGHLGPRVVRHAVEHQDTLRRAYLAHLDAYRVRAQSGVAERMASYVAVLRVAAEVCTAVGCPVPSSDPIEVALKAASEAVTSSDRPREALIALLSWCAAHQSDFYGRGQTAPHGGWAGSWSTRNGAPLGMSEADMSRVLQQSGYRFDDVFRSWQSRGWLEVTGGRSRKKMRVGSTTPWLVAISGKLVDDVLGGEE